MLPKINFQNLRGKRVLWKEVAEEKIWHPSGFDVLGGGGVLQKQRDKKGGSQERQKMLRKGKKRGDKHKLKEPQGLRLKTLQKGGGHIV